MRLWRLVEDDKRGKVLLEASENVWDDLIDEMSDRALIDVLWIPWIPTIGFGWCSICRVISSGD